MKPIELLPEDIHAALKELGSFVDCSEADLMRIYKLAQEHTHQRALENIPARDAMHREVISVSASTSLADVEALLAEHHISGMPVVDDEQRVIGVVSEQDLLFKLENPTFFTLRDRVRHLFGDDSAHRKAHADNLTELMSTPPVTVNDETSLGQVATLLLQRKINRVPVVDGADKLIGIISRADLVRVLHQQQEND